jgi:hypothetical protein
MKWLTRQEQFVLCMVLALLLVGLAVKTYRTANPVTKAAAVSTNDGTNAPAETE